MSRARGRRIDQPQSVDQPVETSLLIGTAPEDLPRRRHRYPLQLHDRKTGPRQVRVIRLFEAAVG